MSPYDCRSIQDLRSQLGLSQREFGDLLGVPQVTVYRWEAGATKPNADHLGQMFDIARKDQSLRFDPFEGHGKAKY